MNWSERLKAPFPFYMDDDRKNIIFILVVSLFVVGFMHVFRPSFSHHTLLTVGQKFLFGGVTFFVLLLDIIFLPKFFPKAFDNFTIGKYILVTALHLILIGIASTIIDEVYICPQRTLWENIKGANLQVALTGFMPVTIIFFFLKNKMLQQNLRSALAANQELQKIKHLKKEVVSKSLSANTPVVLHSDTSETLSLHLPDLLFIEADDNYSTVVWKNGQGIQKKLLRVNLKNIESQINNAYAIRCHRSYIVNVNVISNITGNTNGYKLQILDTDHFIPVSRQKGKEVIEKIQQLRNMMELA
ncbi:MAG TPA: LytTR family DNA-binding domain-containing protein [Ohtaekwangia sp.]|uniref:LytR/AlgR family response regulator transcription factor n=1 Tax=Ohtaekwangia sp. TaxID=2066019 RepID=UPI002F958011